MHNRIRQARLELGLSQREMAEKLGKNPSLVSMWESGDRTPDAYTVFDLADLLGVSAYWLARGSEMPDMPNFIEYNNRHLVVIPVVDQMRYENEKEKFNYRVLGASAYETTMPFYNQYSKNVPPEGLIWVVTDFEDRSMIGMSIYPASVVLIAMNLEINNGSLALVIQEEKLICRKVYFQGPNEVSLIAAHPYVADQIVERDKIKMVGKILASSTMIIQ